MKILLISTNTFQEPMRVFPIGISYISKALKQAGFQVIFLDMAWKEDVEEAIREIILNEMPDLIGLGIRNTDDYNSNPPHLLLPFIRDIVEYIKEAGVDEERIFAGGAALSVLKGPLLEYIGLKYGCIGEGELFFVELAKRIEADCDFKDIPGLIYYNKGSYQVNSPKRLKACEIDQPDFDIYDNKYLTEANKYGMKASLSLQTKRGCIYNCIYCAVPSIEGNVVVCREPRKVVDEMIYIADKFGDYEIDILDNDFNMPREHGEAICNEIIARKLQIPWNCGIHPKFTTKSFLQLLKKANCKRVDVGMETASNRMMRNLNRPSYTSEHLINIAAWCKELDLDMYLAGCIGGPGESYYTLKETFENIEKMNLVSKGGLPTTIFYGGLRIYPGSDLVKVAVREGVIWDNHPLLFPEFYFSKGLDSKAYHLLMEYKEKHPEWLFKGTSMDEWLDRYKEKSSQNISSNENILVERQEGYLNKSITKQIFYDLQDVEVNTQIYNGKNIIFLVAWQQNKDDTREWNLALREEYANNDRVMIQGLGSIPPLPNFLTKDFIKKQLEVAQKDIGPIWLDWDSIFIKGELDLTLSNKTIILGINERGLIKFKEEELFSKEAQESICQKINTVLLNN